MSVLAVIPARLGATRLPRKPLRLLAGLPLVVRVWQRVVELDVADAVVVATDSDEVARVASEHGIAVAMTSVAHSSGTERIAELVQRPAYRGHQAIINVQGDEPFVSRQALQSALRVVADGHHAIGTAAVLATPDILDDPNVVKVVAGDDGRALYFSRAPIPFLRNQTDNELQRAYVWQHIGIYVYTPEALSRWVRLPANPLEQIERLEQLRPLAAGMSIGVALVDEPVRPGIDTEQDLERANREWSAFTTG
ncbi:MAG TPA: 3-deoxy-manno-octulosonate cytidylyltransferase [Gemmatimonadaceae bacterium]|jgi:3-deoxy-manno-octulosonate cytidylyltransferase (CMP-KDO synthetase)|nr:3-deoxy-manno-octulosonate cytidylyltransferase [Gemmatimonadaceae bacterium]